MCLIEKVAELQQNDFSDLINKQAMNYEKLNSASGFCADFSKSMPLQPQKKIQNLEIINAIQATY